MSEAKARELLDEVTKMLRYWRGEAPLAVNEIHQVFAGMMDCTDELLGRAGAYLAAVPAPPADDLVARLRKLAPGLMTPSLSGDLGKRLSQAADRIESLQAEIEAAKHDIERLQDSLSAEVNASIDADRALAAKDARIHQYREALRTLWEWVDNGQIEAIPERIVPTASLLAAPDSAPTQEPQK